jgi:hypothetical protein
MASRVRVVASDGNTQLGIVRLVAAATSLPMDPPPPTQPCVSSVDCVPLTTTPFATATKWTRGTEPKPRGTPQEGGINQEKGRLVLKVITRRALTGGGRCVMKMAVVMVALTFLMDAVADGGASGPVTVSGVTTMG